MALFKTRSGAMPTEPDPTGLSDESVEAMRVRARRRLIGSAILVLLAVVGFPLVFDHQPRSVAPMNVRVDIPSKEQTPSGAPVKPTPATPSAAVAPAPAEVAEEAPLPPPAPVPEPKAAPAASAVPVTPPPASAKPEKSDKTDKTTKADKADKPAAEPAKPAATGERYVVQMGAFSEPEKAKELLGKLGRAGLKAYIQTVKTPDGPRTRVRLGPYTSEDEARKALERVKALNLNLQAQLIKL